MTMNVVHGGFVRMSFKVASDSNDFVAGDVLELQADGTVKAHAGTSTSTVKGLALEKKPSTTTTSADSKKGVPSGDQVAVLLDEAVVETDEITSGITFSPNDTVYPTSGDEKITDANTVSHVIGKALTQTAYGSTVTWFFSVQY